MQARRQPQRTTSTTSDSNNKVDPFGIPSNNFPFGNNGGPGTPRNRQNRRQNTNTSLNSSTSAVSSSPSSNSTALPPASPSLPHRALSNLNGNGNGNGVGAGAGAGRGGGRPASPLLSRRDSVSSNRATMPTSTASSGPNANSNSTGAAGGGPGVGRWNNRRRESYNNNNQGQPAGNRDRSSTLLNAAVNAATTTATATGDAANDANAVTKTTTTTTRPNPGRRGSSLAPKANNSNASTTSTTNTSNSIPNSTTTTGLGAAASKLLPNRSLWQPLKRTSSKLSTTSAGSMDTNNSLSSAAPGGRAGTGADTDSSDHTRSDSASSGVTLAEPEEISGHVGTTGTTDGKGHNIMELNRLREDLDSAVVRLRDVQQENDRLKTVVKDSKAAQARLEAEVEEEKKKRIGVDDALKEAERKGEVLTGSIQNMGKVHGEEMQALLDRNGALEKEVGVLKRNLVEVGVRLEGMETVLSGERKEKERLLEEKRQALRERDAAEEERDKVKEEIVEMQKEKEEAEAMAEQALMDKNDADKERDEMEEKAEKMGSEMKAMKEALDRMRGDVDVMREEKMEALGRASVAESRVNELEEAAGRHHELDEDMRKVVEEKRHLEEELIKKSTANETLTTNLRSIMEGKAAAEKKEEVAKESQVAAERRAIEERRTRVAAEQGRKEMEERWQETLSRLQTVEEELKRSEERERVASERSVLRGENWERPTPSYTVVRGRDTAYSWNRSAESAWQTIYARISSILPIPLTSASGRRYSAVYRRNQTLSAIQRAEDEVKRTTAALNEAIRKLDLAERDAEREEARSTDRGDRERWECTVA